MGHENIWGGIVIFGKIRVGLCGMYISFDTIFTQFQNKSLKKIAYIFLFGQSYQILETLAITGCQ